MSFKSNLLSLLHEKGITPGRLEKILKIGNGAIGKWDDESLPNCKNLLLIADYFDVSADFLLDRGDRYSENNSLTTDEKELLEIYRAVSIEGKAAILTAARAFAGKVDYTKKPAANETA